MKKADSPTYDVAEIKPRTIPPNPRCPKCSDPDPNGRPPMLHMAHVGRCWVVMNGDQCECGKDEG